MALTVTLTASGSAPARAADTATPLRAAPVAPASAAGTTVTLVTGDQVSVVNGRISVRPGSGRERLAFIEQQTGSHRYVIPADALQLIGAKRVDRRLFDVQTLLESGYGDAGSTEVPLLVRPAGGTANTVRPVAPGYRVVRDLPSADVRAVRLDKKQASRFWSSVTGRPAGAGRAATAPQTDRVWLDGRRKLSLDQSTSQIGAPSAWKAGYRGRGVKVAVLDTGIDASHPDFAGRIAEVRNFTTDPSGDDLVGHGTHVASIIAGSGAASHGRYQGVAPEATLLAGKVCTTDSCAESAILAGMEWAATAGATVVNLSLGGADDTEVDPLEAAVDTLTTRYGALFVVAAGNAGPAGRTISSPASADEALAVGAVDSTDSLAFFSSRGPRLADGAVKPELTAPGVDIVAARARNSTPDDSVGDNYARMSGTSMATPHVAGAAALLAERHPGWQAAQLKAGLMGTAVANPALGLDEQGAGRVDIGAAVDQPIRMEPASLGLGTVRWPHTDDTPLDRTVTYHNSGTTTVTLDLSPQVKDPNGQSAPAAMFQITPARVTVPANGSATAVLTVDTRVSAPEGVYQGQLVATGTTGTVHTPLRVNREPESYTLTVRHLDRTGALTGWYNTFLDGVSTPGAAYLYEPDGTTEIRLPRGRYHLTSTIANNQQTGDGVTLLTFPQLDLTRDTSLVLDARKGRGSTVSPPGPQAQPAASAIGYYRKLPGGGISSASAFTFGTAESIFTALLGTAPPGDEMRGRLLSFWYERAADGGLGTGSRHYNLAWFPPGALPSGNYQVRLADLATVEATYRSARTGSVVEKVVTPGRPDWHDYLAFGTAFPANSTRTEYYSANDEARWAAEVRAETTQLSEPTAYRVGTQTEVWQAAPFGPGFPATAYPPQWMSHDGDRMVLFTPLFSDRDLRHAGGADTTSTIATLYRDGRAVPITDWGDYVVGTEPASYRYETEATREAELSPRVKVAWTFRSGGPNHPTQLPVVAVRYTPELDQNDAAPAGSPFQIPIRVQRQTGAAPAETRSLAVSVSYDDGRTWAPAVVSGSGEEWTATVNHPATPGYVSLKAQVVDAAGNTVEQTIIRAYRVGS